MTTTPAAPGAAEPLVSVVTPFYNTAEWLAEAIESVLAQTWGNFEYILADNCSTDGSLEIAQRYAARDSRIRVVTATEFLDQDANYNRALGYISPGSTYCKIVQADDRIHPRCLEEMVKVAAANPRVGIVSCCFLMGNALAGHGLPFDRTVFSGREACRQRLLQGGTYFGSPTCLLYRSEIVRTRKPFYRPNETNADTTSCFEILADWDFALVPQILCTLRVSNGSVTSELRRLSAEPYLNYSLVVRYGPLYLEPEELDRRRRELRRIYLDVLARDLLRRPGPRYWNYHRQLFGTLGEELPRAEIGLRLLDYLLDKLLNPRHTLGLALDALRQRRRR
jgi:glycosyltransferase involved in cell wall biosynthesis